MENYAQLKKKNDTNVQAQRQHLAFQSSISQ